MAKAQKTYNIGETDTTVLQHKRAFKGITYNMNRIKAKLAFFRYVLNRLPKLSTKYLTAKQTRDFAKHDQWASVKNAQHEQNLRDSENQLGFHIRGHKQSSHFYRGAYTINDALHSPYNSRIPFILMWSTDILNQCDRIYNADSRLISQMKQRPRYKTTAKYYIDKPLKNGARKITPHYESNWSSDEQLQFRNTEKELKAIASVRNSIRKHDDYVYMEQPVEINGSFPMDDATLVNLSHLKHNIEKIIPRLIRQRWLCAKPLQKQRNWFKKLNIPVKAN